MQYPFLIVAVFNTPSCCCRLLLITMKPKAKRFFCYIESAHRIQIDNVA